MTRDEIIKMAELCDLGQVCGPLSTLLDHEWESLHRFAALVATAEREACAKVCDSEAARALANWRGDVPSNQPFWNGAENLVSGCAAAIRARGAA